MTESPASAKSPAAQRLAVDIRVESASHYVRPLEASDASERVCAWFGEPQNARMLNRAAQALTLGQFREYVASHDRISGHVLGMFDKASHTQVGLWSIYIDWELSEFLVSAIVGEHGPISAGARAETQRELLKVLFEDMGLETVRAAALTENTRVHTRVLDPAGVSAEHVSYAPSPNKEAFVEIRHYRVSKQEWRDLRARLTPELAAQVGV